jgi:hypothetical protein
MAKGRGTTRRGRRSAKGLRGLEDLGEIVRRLRFGRVRYECRLKKRYVRGKGRRTVYATCTRVRRGKKAA